MFPILSIAQIASNLKNTKVVFDIANFDRTQWSLWGQYNKLEYMPIKSENVIVDIDNYLSDQSNLSDSSKQSKGSKDEYQFIKKYRDNIDSVFKNLGMFGSDQLGNFLYSKSSLPIHFGATNDTCLSFIISGIYIDNIYNTIKLSSRQRATKVVTTYILPALPAFAKAFAKDNDIKYFGIACLYGSKDFASSSSLSTKAEFVGFLIPVNLLKLYSTGSLTEDELIAQADIYLSDRDMVVGIKKIKITIE